MYPGWLRQWPFICFSVQCECKHKPSCDDCDCDECWPQIYRGTLLPNPLLASRGFMLCYFPVPVMCTVILLFLCYRCVWAWLSSLVSSFVSHTSAKTPHPTPLGTVKNTNKIINFINFYFPEKRHLSKPHCLQETELNNRPVSYSNGWTGSSMKWRLMRGN